jgi:uncharacterized membrane protein
MVGISMPAKLIRRLAHLEAHHRLALSVIGGLIAFLFIGRHTRLPLRLITAWDAYAACVLGLAWNRILSAQPAAVVRMAKLRNTSRIVIFLGVLAAAFASLGAVAYLLGSAKDLPVATRSTHVALAVATVVLSWTMVHTLFALHYAYQFYRAPQCVQSESSKRPLIFPGDDLPDYYDFAYFSFVIGMTCQVSDVQISSKALRRLATVHGLISFAFNTAILAMFVNILAGLI